MIYLIKKPPILSSRSVTTNVAGLSVVSLDKALEVNHLSARVGDNVEIKCDVSGTPPPPIVWRRNTADLSSLGEDEVRVFTDGSLYLTRIQLVHAGNYTCHAQRNRDVTQTHVLTVHSELIAVPLFKIKTDPRPMPSGLLYIYKEPGTFNGISLIQTLIPFE